MFGTTSSPRAFAVRHRGIHGRRGSWAALWLTLMVLAFYVATLAPSVVWGDGARLQSDAVTGSSMYMSLEELANLRTDGFPFGRLGVAAWDHPLWVMLGHGVLLLPWGADAYLLNLMSAIPAALAIGMVALVLLELGTGRLGALLGGLALAVAHTFWFHAVTAEVYALDALFMATLIWLTLRWDRTRQPGLLVAAAFLTGLGMANHVILALTAAVAAVFVVWAWRSEAGSTDSATRRDVAALPWLVGLTAFVVGFAPWWLQFLRMVRVAGLVATIQLVLGMPWLAGRFPGDIGWATVANSAEYLGMLLYQFTPFGVAAGAYGIVVMAREKRRAAVFLATLFVVHAVFSANYAVPDRFAFHLPSYLVFALFIGFGAKAIVCRISNLTSRRLVRLASLAAVLTPIALYSIAPSLLGAFGVTQEDLGIPRVGTGARDGVSYFLDPNQRGDESAAVFGRGSLEGLEPDAVVLTAWPADQEIYIVLRYFQLAEELRTDVHLDLMMFGTEPLHDRVLDTARIVGRCRALYLASLNPELYPLEALRVEFSVVPKNSLFRLLPRDGGESGDCTVEPPQASLEELIRKVRS